MRRSHSIRRGSAVTATLLLAGVAACGILDTQQPNIVDAGELDTPAGAATKRLGAISTFTLAKDGDFNPVAIPGSDDTFNDNSDGHILLSGTLADEFVNPGFIPSRTEVDLRLAQDNTAGLAALFQSLHRARSAAEDAAVSLEQFGADPATDTGIPEMLALAGFTYIFLGEDFCSGVPVSRIVNDTIAYGQPLTTAQIFDTAIVRFNLALTHPSIAPGDPIHSLVSVGLGRALLNQGLFPEAAAAVATVPADFLYETEHATTPAALHNGVFEAFSNGNFGVFDQEGGNGLDYVSAEDLRVEGDSGLGADNNTESWFPSKYPSFESSIPTADYLEAQLIIAEGELQAGGFAAMTQRLNDLRAAAGLDDLGQPGDLVEATDLLFRERAFWLFATGHRLGDLRRLIRQYGRDAETVFPTGDYYKGGLTYGTAVNLPIPRREQNNPNGGECLDREA
ncbi:MAG: RagB/SusD family nutrient uptake outer membrane protein [Gemmatimonadota bacterium]|nr:RagB/SusD family nutrient uptake outer membrane protein [Gemmatimonadota bacterium]